MSDIAQVADLLARTDRQFEWTQRRASRGRVWFFVTIGPLYLVVLGLGVYWTVLYWQGQRQDDLVYLDYLLLALFQLQAGLGFARIYLAFESDARGRLFGPLGELRAAISRGDTTRAPAVAVDGPPLGAGADGSMLGEGLRIGPLLRPMKWSNPFLILALVLLSTALVLVPVVLAYESVQAGIIVAAALFPLTAIFSLLAHRALGPTHVHLDAEGLRWPRLLGGYHHMLWRECQSLLQIGDTSLILYDRQERYILAGTNHVFMWVVTQLSEQGRAGAASQSLLRAIVRSTGLPLRDVSTEVRELSHLLGASTRMWASKDTIKHRLRVLGIALLPFVIVSLLEGLALSVQQPYFEYQYGRAHASAPLYADSLRHADSDWRESDTSGFDSGEYRVTNDLEHFTGVPRYVPTPRHVDHALYEVTGFANTGRYNEGEIGLAIRSSRAPFRVLTFGVTLSGEWSLSPSSLDVAQVHSSSFPRHSDRSDAIHTDITATNRIGVLVQGSDFAFFVNGHFVYHYNDATFAGGYVGLYLGIVAEYGYFSDFAVYPV